MLGLPSLTELSTLPQPISVNYSRLRYSYPHTILCRDHFPIYIAKSYLNRPQTHLWLNLAQKSEYLASFCESCVCYQDALSFGPVDQVDGDIFISLFKDGTVTSLYWLRDSADHIHLKMVREELWLKSLKLLSKHPTWGILKWNRIFWEAWWHYQLHVLQEWLYFDKSIISRPFLLIIPSVSVGFCYIFDVVVPCWGSWCLCILSLTYYKICFYELFYYIN